MPGLIDRLRRAMSALRAPDPSERPKPTVIGMPEMLGSLGAALLASSRATSAVESTMRELSTAYGEPQLRTFVLPTLVLVEDAATPERTSIFPATGPALRLDQAGDVETLVSRANATRMAPADVIRELDRIRATKPRFGTLVTILGHTILTLGFGLVLNPTASALPVYVVLGAVVGTIVVLCARLATLALILPILTSFLITVIAGIWIVPLVGDDPIRLVAPALVSFLPGLTLTLAAVELTSNQVVAGASRMVYGLAQLGLLAFGVFAAVTVLGPMAQPAAPPQLGAWAPWVGIFLTALGYTLFSVAPRGAFIWILFALAVAYGAQLLGTFIVGAELSGFVGAVVVIPVVNLVRQLPWAPPAAVMLTCAYWLLVPGALGFIGLTGVAEGTPGAVTLVAQTFLSLVAIAIGMVVGAGISRDAGAVTRAWRGERLPSGSRGGSGARPEPGAAGGQPSSSGS
jgi:uncharacterized membrane protein YjjP (DUF1212 family)